MKKILMLICAGAITCSMCACGGNSAKTDTDNIDNDSQIESSQPAEQ